MKLSWINLALKPSQEIAINDWEDIQRKADKSDLFVKIPMNAKPPGGWRSEGGEEKNNEAAGE